MPALASTTLGIRFQIHLLVLQTAPQPLNKHAIDPAALAVQPKARYVYFNELDQQRVYASENTSEKADKLSKP